MRGKLRLVAAVFALTACASAPRISYYTFDMDASGAARPSVNLVVEGVRTTDALGRGQIMIQASPTRIEYYATAQWAGDLAGLVGEKLTAEFGPAVEGRRTLLLKVMVLSCEQVDVTGGAAARMKLAVSMSDPAERTSRVPLLEKTYEASRPVARPAAGAVAEGLSLCAEEIAGEIAADAAAL
jgi:ABC-type uncharacterized transport system auxiliary subunit